MAETLGELFDQEDALLDAILEKQAALRASVNGRNWNSLVKIIENLGELSEKFAAAEERRAALNVPEGAYTGDEREKLTRLRGKLVRSQAENKALGEYVSIMHGFVKGVIDKAMPQSRNRLYGADGRILESRPSSIVVNTLF